jgi:CRISPR-associated endonuclease Cas1
MAAAQTVNHFPQDLKSAMEVPRPLTPRHGVVTLFGYGITVNVDRGHLILKDGIGAERREGRFSRVGHGLRRLVIIGSDGFVSLGALRWLADQDAAFVMLERDGSVLATTGPVRPSDARLRRAQSLAHQSGTSLQIARELIEQKLRGQERVARDVLQNSSIAVSIASFRAALSTAQTIEAVRSHEAQAAQAYWSAWKSIPINFPRKDVDRVPNHWQYFGTRKSPLSGSPRLAINPPNAMLNYLYALLESEARLAASALGLDPGIGVLHVDTDARDSLACDLMEPIRPQVDAYLLNWLSREPLRREWFFEQRDGNCRLMGSFAVRLSETAQTWGRAVAPIAEWVSRTLWAKRSRPSSATRLTENYRRQVKGIPSSLSAMQPPQVPVVCRICGSLIQTGQKYCVSCAVTASTEALVDGAIRGRIASHSDEAEVRRAESQRRHHAAKRGWQPSNNPDWLDEDTYRQKIQPRLSGITVPAISSALGISVAYATDIRAGRRRPHPRHWQTLAQLLGISPDR